MKALFVVLIIQAVFVGVLAFIALCVDAHYKRVRQLLAARRLACRAPKRAMRTVHAVA